MKCPTCGGLIILEQGICGEPDRLKCILCGRDPNKVEAINKSPLQEGDDDMANPEVKRDEEGNVIIPKGYIYQPEHIEKGGEVVKEHFRKYGYKKPKNPKRNYRAEYKRLKEKKAAAIEIPPVPIKTRSTKVHSKAITIATPEEIIKALRKGVAQEIIQAIQEKFA